MYIYVGINDKVQFLFGKSVFQYLIHVIWRSFLSQMDDMVIQRWFTENNENKHL